MACVEDVDHGVEPTGGEIVSPPASALWECAVHRRFRIYVNGKIERLQRRPN